MTKTFDIILLLLTLIAINLFGFIAIKRQHIETRKQLQTIQQTIQPQQTVGHGGTN